MNKRVDAEYIKKILELANKNYEQSANAHREGNKVLLDPENPHLFVFGCVMDSQIHYERAWDIPRIIAKELGSDSFSAFLSKDLDWYVNTFKRKALHRYNTKMANALYSAIHIIDIKYDGDASNIWNDCPSSGELVSRFLEFDRVGVKIATMAANILSRDYGVKLKDKSSIDISPDVHVKRTMYRLGLIDEIQNVAFRNIPVEKITYAARSINPEFPGVFDKLFWEIGENKICQNSVCNREKCPFGNFCVRQGIASQ